MNHNVSYFLYPTFHRTQNPEGPFCATFPKVAVVLDMNEEDVGRFNETTKKIDFYEDEELEEEYEK